MIPAVTSVDIPSRSVQAVSRSGGQEPNAVSSASPKKEMPDHVKASGSQESKPHKPGFIQALWQSLAGSKTPFAERLMAGALLLGIPLSSMGVGTTATGLYMSKHSAPGKALTEVKDVTQTAQDKFDEVPGWDSQDQERAKIFFHQYIAVLASQATEGLTALLQAHGRRS